MWELLADPLFIVVCAAIAIEGLVVVKPTTTTAVIAAIAVTAGTILAVVGIAIQLYKLVGPLPVTVIAALAILGTVVALYIHCWKKVPSLDLD